MATNEIANRLVELCRSGNFDDAQNELFSEDAVSVEQYATPEFDKETKGLNAMREKSKKWNDMIEKAEDIKVSEPLVATSSFAVTLQMHVTMKGGHEMDMHELCVYEVKDGKIIKEEFFM